MNTTSAFTTPLIEKTKEYCFKIIEASRCQKLPFHNAVHTFEVYEFASKIAVYDHVEENEMEIVLLASLFHDTGNSRGPSEHEALSAKKARNFFLQEGLEPSKINKVLSCIRATKMPQKPENLLEMIICDADLAHLGTCQFAVKSELLRREWAKYCDKDFSDREWLQLNIEFLQQHKFFTNYGKDHLAIKQEENLHELQKKMKTASYS